MLFLFYQPSRFYVNFYWKLIIAGYVFFRQMHEKRGSNADYMLPLSFIQTTRPSIISSSPHLQT